MSREKTTRQALASRLSAAAGQVRPFARNTMAAGTRAVRKTRAWSAPRVERTGQALQDSVAPKVASSLSSVAQRLDPGKPRSARWRRPAGIATVSAAASAVAAVARHRRKTGTDSSPAGQEGLPPAAETGDRRATASADTDGQGGTS